MPHPRLQTPLHVNTWICVSPVLKLTSDLSSTPSSTIPYTSALSFERHYQPLLHQYMLMAHRACCSLFIHLCGGLYAWRSTASFFSLLSPSLPLPKEIVDHKPTTVIVQHTDFIQTKGTASVNHITQTLKCSF